MTKSKLSTAFGDVSIAVEGPDHPRQLLLLAHGAGAPMDSDFLKVFARSLTSDSRSVARFNFPYMEQGRRTPGSPKASEGAFGEVVDNVKASLSPKQLFIGGKSYGGRMASHLAASGADVDGLVFLGYPLHAPGRPENIRDAHLYELDVPMLFVEGTRDPFCPLPTLERVLARLPQAELVVIEDGDHSLKVRKASGRDTPTAWGEAAEAIAAWLERRAR